MNPAGTLFKLASAVHFDPCELAGSGPFSYNVKMNRKEFLSRNWQRYPQARPQTRDVAMNLKKNSPDGWVAGRLENLTGRECRISSGGATSTFTLAPEVFILSLDPLLRAKPNVLTVGDIVGLEINQSRVRSVELLCPCTISVPNSGGFTVERSQDWADFVSSLREFFSGRDFIEANTPTLVVSPGTEPFLEPFSTDWKVGAKSQIFYLPTSPEFHLKKMLAAGWTRIFELKNCFRNGEISGHHQPEFTMLEWYRAYCDLDAIADDCEALFSFLVARHRPEWTGMVLKRTTMAELFRSAFDGFLLTPQSPRDDLLGAARSAGLRVDESDDWDQVFFRLFIEKIEPHLGKDGPLLVRGYPPSQAALARIGPDGFADRFEIYWRGLELANAFHELNDPEENEKRFAADNEKKKAIGLPTVPIDTDLVRALYAGLPPSGGIALGVDRLFMALFEVKEIESCRAFPQRLP